MASNFPLPHLDRLSAVYEAANQNTQSLMESQLSGKAVDEQLFSQCVAKRLCTKDAMETIVKDVSRVNSMALKES